MAKRGYLSFSLGSNWSNLSCDLRDQIAWKVAAYWRQWHCSNQCDNDFAAPHRFAKVVPAVLLPISGVTSIDICMKPHVTCIMYHVASMWTRAYKSFWASNFCRSIVFFFVCFFFMKTQKKQKTKRTLNTAAKCYKTHSTAKATGIFEIVHVALIAHVDQDGPNYFHYRMMQPLCVL